MSKARRLYYQRGYSIPEICIVLIIIVFLTGSTIYYQGYRGITTAQILALKQTAQKTIMDVQEFRNRYEVTPGEMSTASNFWPECENGGALGENGLSGANLLVWKHLKSAGLITKDMPPHKNQISVVCLNHELYVQIGAPKGENNAGGLFTYSEAHHWFDMPQTSIVPGEGHDPSDCSLQSTKKGCIIRIYICPASS